MKDFNFLQKKYIVPTYTNRGVTFVRGEGAYLIDVDGNKYLDLMTNYGVSIFGHSHPTITQALKTQLEHLTMLHSSFPNDTRSLASQHLIDRIGKQNAQVYWSSSGTEAIEAALKFSVLATGKKKFIAANNGYHGKTLGALSANGTAKYRAPFEPLLWSFDFVEYGDIASLEKNINAETAAVLLEPLQGEGGIVPPSPGYLKNAQELCKKYGALLIVDEIQTGMGRTGTLLASEQEKLEANMYCLGKGLAGGIPVGATVVAQEVAAKIPKGIHTSTFGGNPLACAGVIASLELLSDEMFQTINGLGKTFIERLQKISSPRITAVRGKGLMIGVQVTENRDGILKQLQQEKILAIPAGEDVVRFLPPYIVTKEELIRAGDVLEKILNISSRT